MFTLKDHREEDNTCEVPERKYEVRKNWPPLATRRPVITEEDCALSARMAAVSPNPTTKIRRGILLDVANPRSSSVVSVADKHSVSVWLVNNVLEGFAHAGVPGALIGQWIDSSTRLADLDLAKGAAEWLCGEADKTDEEVEVDVPEWLANENEKSVYMPPEKMALDTRFPGIVAHFATTGLTSVSPTFAALTFADYVDSAVGILGTEDEFLDKAGLTTLADRTQAAIILHDIVDVGRQYLAARNLSVLLTVQSGALTALIHNVCTDNRDLLLKLSTKMTENFATLYLHWRAVHDQFTNVLMRDVAEASNVETGVYANKYTMSRAVEVARREFPEVEKMQVKSGQFVPGHNNWLNNVMSVDNSSVSTNAAVQKLTTNDERLLLMMVDDNAQAVNNAEAIINAFGADGATVESVAKETELTVDEVNRVLLGYERFGVVGAVFGQVLRDDLPMQLRAAAQVHAAGKVGAYTDMQTTRELLGDKADELLRQFGVVQACGDLKLSPTYALHAAAVLEDANKSFQEVSNELWLELLFASNEMDGEELVPASKLTLENLQQVRMVIDEYNEMLTKPVEPVVHEVVKKQEPVCEQVEVKPVVKPVEEVKQVVKELVEKQVVAVEKQTDSNDVGKRLQSVVADCIERLCTEVKGIVEPPKRDTNKEMVDELVNAEVNGIKAMDAVNLALMPFGMRLQVVDGVLVPSKL